MPKKTPPPFVPDEGSLKRLRKSFKRGGTFTLLSLRGETSRRYGPGRILVPLAIVKGKITNVSDDVTCVVDLKWSDDNTLRSISDPYRLTRIVATALYGRSDALETEVLR